MKPFVCFILSMSIFNVAVAELSYSAIGLVRGYNKKIVTLETHWGTLQVRAASFEKFNPGALKSVKKTKAVRRYYFPTKSIVAIKPDASKKARL